MMTTKISLLVPTGTPPTKWHRRKEIVVSYPRPGIRLEWTDTGTSLTRFWLSVSNRCILSTTTWSLCPEQYLRSCLQDNGINLRYGDTLKDYGSKNGLRDVYITSKSLEKLC